VAHISGQYGKGILRIAVSLSDFEQGIHGKSMTQRMWCGLKKVHIADHPLGLIKADIFQRFVEQESDMAVRCQEGKGVPAPFLRVLFLAVIPAHRQRRDLVATFDHSDIRGLVTA
jgi:hypothetical protein